MKSAQEIEALRNVGGDAERRNIDRANFLQHSDLFF